MSTSIIEIVVEEFLSRKINITSDEALKQKYTELYEKNTCFHANVMIVPSHHHHSTTQSTLHPRGKHTHNHQHNHLHAHNRRFQHANKPPNFPKNKSMSRIITSILNVINKDNYHKVLTKLRLLKNESNIEMIIEEILKKSATQVFYQKLYCDILKDILSMCCPIERSLMLQKIEQFVTTFIESKDWTMLEDDTPSITTSTYDDFCHVQKHKTRILASNDLIMKLVNIGNLSQSILTNYIENLYNDFQEMIMHHKTEKASSIILILEMLINICGSQRDKVRDIVRIKFTMDRCKDIESNKKMLFLYQDFNKVVHS